MKAIAHICDFMMHAFDDKFIDGSIYDVIRDMAPSFGNTIVDCLSPDKAFGCSDLFVPIFTQDGQCFSFNDLNSHQVFTDE